MPGLGASSEIFEFLNFKQDLKLIPLSWIPPKNGESIEEYAIRMCRLVKHEKPSILGVSFGGILIQEMSRHLSFDKVIIVSSVKSNKELPLTMFIAKQTKAYRLLPVQWINNLESLALFVFGDLMKKRITLYKKYLSVRDPQYLSWAINELINWKRSKASSNVIHIHGDNDNIFPSKNLKNAEIISGANHAMILIESNWFNENIPLILADKYIFKNKL